MRIYDDPSVLYDSPSVLYDDGAPPVAYTIEVAFATTDPLTDSPAWTDVTSWVRSFSTRRGRNHELGRTGAGTATITLDNLDRRFDPTNASSPYYPNVKPMKQVRIRSISPSVSDVFRGFVEDWGQAWAGPAAPTLGDATVPLQAVDGFKVLQLLAVSNYRSEVLKDSPVVYVPFDDSVGSATAQNLGSAGGEFFYGLQTAMPGRATSPIANGIRRSLDITDVPTAYESASLIITGPGVCEFAPLTVEAWVYLDALPSDFNAALAIFQADPLLPPGDIGTNDVSITQTGHVQWHGPGQGTGSVLISNGTLSLGTWHHIVCTADTNWSGEADAKSAGDAIYIDGAFDRSSPVEALFTQGAAENTWWTTSTHSFDGAQAHLAFYDYVLPADRIAAHYAAASRLIDRIEGSSGAAIGELLDAVGWPPGLRAIGTGASTVALTPEGAALELAQSIAEDTEHGILEVTPDGKLTFIGRDSLEGSLSPVATFGDGGGAEIPYQDLQLSYDDQDLWTETDVSGVTEVVASDASAITSYARRTLGVSTLAATATEVYDQAYGLLNRYKAPAIRPVSMTLHSSRALTQQLTRSIGERVTIKRRPPGGGTLSVDAIIEGIDHDLGPDGWPVTTFQLAPPEPLGFWVLAHATYGVLDSTSRLGW